MAFVGLGVCATFSALASSSAPRIFLRSDNAVIFDFPPPRGLTASLQVWVKPLKCKFKDGSQEKASIQYFFKNTNLGTDLIGVTVDVDLDGEADVSSQNVSRVNTLATSAEELENARLSLKGNPLGTKSWETLAQDIYKHDISVDTFGHEPPEEGVLMSIYQWISLGNGTINHLTQEMQQDLQRSNHLAKATYQIKQRRMRRCLHKWVVEHEDSWAKPDAPKRLLLEKHGDHAYYVLGADVVMIAATVMTAGQAGLWIKGATTGARKVGERMIFAGLTKEFLKKGTKEGLKTLGVGNSLHAVGEGIRTKGEAFFDKNFYITQASIGIANFMSGFATKLRWNNALVLDYGVSAVSTVAGEMIIKLGQPPTQSFVQANGLYGGVIAQPRAKFWLDFVQPRIYRRTGPGSWKGHAIFYTLWGGIDQLPFNAAIYPYLMREYAEQPYDGIDTEEVVREDREPARLSEGDLPYTVIELD